MSHCASTSASASISVSQTAAVAVASSAMTSSSSSSATNAHMHMHAFSSSSGTTSSHSTSASDADTLSSLYKELEALIEEGQGQSTYDHLALKPRQTQQLSKVREIIQRVQLIQQRQKDEKNEKDEMMKDIDAEVKDSESKKDGDAQMSDDADDDDDDEDDGDDDQDDDDDPIHWGRLFHIPAQDGNIPLLRLLLDANICKYPGLAIDAVVCSSEDCLRFILDYEDEHGLTGSKRGDRDYTLNRALARDRPLSTLQILYEHGAEPDYESYEEVAQAGRIDQCRWIEQHYDPDPDVWWRGLRYNVSYEQCFPFVEYLMLTIKDKWRESRAAWEEFVHEVFGRYAHGDQWQTLKQQLLE